MVKNFNPKLEKNLLTIFQQYNQSFKRKNLKKDETSQDIIMNIFGKKQIDVDVNKQYWNREFGKFFEIIVVRIFKLTNKNFKPALRIGADEPCDCLIGNIAIDVKYRVGSGDSGTLKKFKQYGNLLIKKGYKPVMLFLREDNLFSAVTAIKKGGWEYLVGEKTFDFIKKNSGFDLFNFFKNLK